MEAYKWSYRSKETARHTDERKSQRLTGRDGERQQAVERLRKGKRRHRETKKKCVCVPPS